MNSSYTKKSVVKNLFVIKRVRENRKKRKAKIVPIQKRKFVIKRVKERIEKKKG